MKKLLFASLALLPAPALALDVSSPYVKEGLMEIETKNRIDDDHRQREDDFRRHSLSLNYGFSRWWALEVVTELEKQPDSGYGLAASAIENTFQLTTRGAYWLDAGIKLNYEMAHENGEPDEMEARLMLAKNVSRMRYMANIAVKQEVGDYSNDNPTSEVRLQTRYNYNKYFSPGVEYYAELGEWSDMQGWNAQKHRFGPAFYGKLADGVAYDTGLIFGISDKAEDTVFKLNLKYEFSL